MACKVYAVDRPELPPFPMPSRFRADVAYFKETAADHGAAKPPPGEYRLDLNEVREWLEDGAVTLVSPLDSEHPAEVELTEEQEAWLEWLVEHQIQHVRVVCD